MDSPVADTSTLKAFAEVGRLDLLLEIFPAILVPAAVVRELEQMSSAGNLDLLERIGQGGGFRRCDLPASVIALAKEYSTRLGAGESEVIAMARLGRRLALLDDLKARQIATADGVSVVGSLGILAAAKHRGLIGAARPIVEAMVLAGRYISPELLRRYYRELGES